jgi:hypothetical protein
MDTFDEWWWGKVSKGIMSIFASLSEIQTTLTMKEECQEQMINGKWLRAQGSTSVNCDKCKVMLSCWFRSFARELFTRSC